MKPWFSLILVCGALLFLLLSLSQQVGLNHPLQVAGSSQWLDRCREPTPGSPTASVVRSTQFDPARSGPHTARLGRRVDCWQYGSTRLVLQLAPNPTVHFVASASRSRMIFDWLGTNDIAPSETFRNALSLQCAHMIPLME